MRVLTLAVALASLALFGAAQVAQAECAGHKQKTVDSGSGTLTVTATQPASGNVAGSKKQAKKESGS